jgi:hypothetical protein
VITHNFDSIIQQIHAQTRSFEKPLRNFYGYMLRQTDLTFRKLGPKNSGRFREVSWPWFSPVRKSDGTVVEPEGVRVRHSFNRYRMPRGKKRPATHYVQSDSRLLADTGRLKAAALSTFRVSDFELQAETDVQYADEQQQMRPFAFLTDADVEHLRKMLIKHVIETT